MRAPAGLLWRGRDAVTPEYSYSSSSSESVTLSAGVAPGTSR